MSSNLSDYQVRCSLFSCSQCFLLFSIFDPFVVISEYDNANRTSSLRLTSTNKKTLDLLLQEIGEVVKEQEHVKAEEKPIGKEQEDVKA